MAQTKRNKRADRVWDRLIQSYGTRIAEVYGVDIPKPWIDSIEDLSDEQIAYGLKAVLRISPAHPPTLGQFSEACSNMPIAQGERGPTIQEQLCAYAAIQLKHLATSFATDAERLIYSRQWTYCYREWWDATRPKGMERCAECVGIVIDMDDGKKLGWSVTQMRADEDGYRQAMRTFRPAARPNPEFADQLALGQVGSFKQIGGVA